MPQISIIVPVYQSEKFLKKCIECILSQTFSDIELILVDDGSTDGSGRICDEYAIEDNRVVVIHQKNKGASAARNMGMSIARGKYLMFCDSDDEVSPMWVQRLLSLSDKETLPIGAYCNNLTELGKQKVIFVNSNEKVPVCNYYKYNCAGIAGYICNALYMTDIVKDNNLYFREKFEMGDYNEDLIFALRYVSYIKNIVYTGYADYMYKVRNDSMSKSFDKYYFEKYSEKYALWKSFLENSEEERKDLASKMIYHFLSALQKEFEAKKGYRRFKQIVLSDETQECVRIGDVSKENPKIIKMIKKKKAFSLYLFYSLISLKKKRR